ncbi:MAG: hypothetical protein PWQ31_699 [Eubacteriales bacterium]|nr:hypothetical protein [Eubacteriales bacterium]
MDITRNIKAIEWLKAELVSALSYLFRATVKGGEEMILDALASLTVLTYVLARRLGFSFARLDMQVDRRLQDGVEKGYEAETWFGDLSALREYRRKSMR